jgi:hypothetical protein
MLLWFDPKTVDEAKEAEAQEKKPRPNHSEDCGCEDCCESSDEE